MWNGHKSMNDDSWITIQKSTSWTNIKERHDHSTAIADAQGRLIAQAEMSLPIHLASLLDLMRILVARYGDDIAEGDLFIANDPHVAGGTHLPDINMAMPVFAEGRLVAFVSNLAHHADVGGAARGSMSGGMSEIYQEGLRIPVMRLYRRGELDTELFDLLLLNMRLPAERRGDLNAQIAACRLGVERLQQLLARYGTRTVEGAFGQILERTAARIGALADVLPEQAIGAANGANTSMVFAGVDPRNGAPYVYLETLGGGMGGRNDRDGKDGVQVHITNTSNLPVEAIETEYPLRVEEYALVVDSGGAGRFRGGMGLRRSVRPVGHTCEFNGVGERFRLAPWGIFGGEPGLRGRFQLHNADGALSELPPKTGRMELGPDQAE